MPRTVITDSVKTGPDLVVTFEIQDTGPFQRRISGPTIVTLIGAGNHTSVQIAQAIKVIDIVLELDESNLDEVITHAQILLDGA